MNDRVVSSTGSLTRLRMAASNAAIATPTTRPPTTASTKSPSTTHTPMLAVIAAVAVRSETRAVASLSRLSPSRMDTSRRGMPTRRPMVVAATASGGATIAPSASPAASDTFGSNSQAMTPTTIVVKTTAPTARMPMACRLARTSTSEVRKAAA